MHYDLDPDLARGYFEAALVGFTPFVKFNNVESNRVKIEIFTDQGKLLHSEKMAEVDILYKSTLIDYLTIVREYLEERGYVLQPWNKTYSTWPMLMH